MPHQAPHPISAADDDDVAHLSTPGLGMTPRTLSFINNVQSAVAQIEHRLATSPSAQPPPPNRQELPQTPPGPNDAIIDRVQFLESSLSLAPPTSSNLASRSGSSFAGAINLDNSLVSSGAIISTAPPNTINPNESTPFDDSHTSETQRQPDLPSAPEPETAHGARDISAPSIAPIVEHFETAGNPAQAKEQLHEIVAAPIAPIVEQFEVPSTGTTQTPQVPGDDVTPVPIAPIVEHFETGSQILENTSDPQNIEPSNEAPIAPVVKESEADGQKFMSFTDTGPNYADVDPKSISFEKIETATSTCSKQIEPEIPAGRDILAAVPTVSNMGQDCESRITTLEAPSSLQENAQCLSNETDEFTAVPDVDCGEHVKDGLEGTGLSGAVSTESNRAKTAALTSQEIAELKSRTHNPGGLDPSCSADGKSQSLTKAVDEKTNASEEGSEVMRQKTDLGGLSEDASLDRTEPKSKDDIGDTSVEMADVPVSPIRPCDEEEEPQPSLDHEISTPSELTDAVATEAVCPTSIVPPSGQTDSKFGASCAPTPIPEADGGEIEMPVHSRVNQETLDMGGPTSGSGLNSKDEISNIQAGDTGPTKDSESSSIYLGRSANVETINEDENILAPVSDTVNIDDSTVTDTEHAIGEVGVTEAEQKHSHECNVSENSAQSSTSSPEDNESPRSGLVSSTPEELAPNASVERQSPPEATIVNQDNAQENPVESEAEEQELEAEVGREKNAVALNKSEQVPREVNPAEEREDEAVVGAKSESAFSVSRDPVTQIRLDGSPITNEQEARENMAAKAVFARDKLAKFSLSSPVKKPHRGLIIRKTGDAQESAMKGAGSVTLSPRTRRTPGGCSMKKGSNNRRRLAATSDTAPNSAMLDKVYDSPEQCKPRSPSTPSRGTDIMSRDLPLRQSATETRRTPPPRPKSIARYAVSDNRQAASQREPKSPLLLPQSCSENKLRLPRVATLTSAKGGSPRTPHSAPNLRGQTGIPRAATFSVTVPRSKSAVSSPIAGRRIGISSSPVTPTSVGKSSAAVRPQLRRTLSFTQTKPPVEPTSPLSRPVSSRLHGSDVSSGFSLPTSGSKPPRGGRPRFTVPEPFALAGPELQDRTEKQMEEARRKAAEADARPRVFKPRPMPDFSKPYPKPK